ncbi:MAG: hydantoinase B/oxoprolinase family protein [Candidatus Tectomicrobia bacterium]|uniref:Hydantoinase B/oxoprolinase family protein n=1 Tax=Tectimicrobiota bacterium TaxID=2528274 RepID=A0A932MNE1_UNCTE|nr:hydantoinase B/oxoprolinase family protein [Candidatus Tectomicrobia bacterium]
MSPDPILLEVFRSLFFSASEEMGVALCRSSFSPNIKERRDYSCALFDAEGRMAAQAAHLPAHLGSMPMSVEYVIGRMRLDPGDMVALNDPFHGGNHLPDITLIAPVYAGKRLVYYAANRAHHADVGGSAPGSMSITTEIFQDGVVIPPVRLVRGGKVEEDVLALILANVRTPEEREGDLSAQIAANRVGERRLLEIIGRHGLPAALRYTRELQAYAERMTRAAIRSIPDGAYRFEDFMDDDGAGSGPVPIRVEVTVKGDRLRVDFTGSAPQTRGSVNAVESIARTAAYYAVRCLVPYDIPNNAGCMDPIEVIAPPGTVVNSVFPAAVAGGNVETSQRMVDVVLGALAQACPGIVPAASCGTMNNLSIGGLDPRRGHRGGKSYAYYETTGGGMGGGPLGPGEDAIHTHLTNTMNTPVEALEHAYPFRVRRYTVRRGSGGRGLHRGGDGIVREIELRADATVSFMTERRVLAPYPLKGGRPGATGRNSLLRGGKAIRLPGKARVEARAGDVIRIETPGGGGWGRPGKKDKASLKGNRGRDKNP